MKSQKIIKNDTLCEILWMTQPSEAWEGYFDQIKCSNLLQSPLYAKIMARLNHQRIRWGMIRINGDDAGIVQILEAGLFKNIVHGVMCDRGPLWLEGFGSISDFECFVKEFARQFPKRLGRRIRFIPEVETSEEHEGILKRYGFTRKNEAEYQTYWLDLEPDLDTLRANLKKRWRYELRKGEAEDLKIEWSDEGKHFGWLMNEYGRDKDARGYDGASVNTMVALASEFSRGKNLLIGTALLEGRPIASILILNHGRSATYQVGYTSDKGRDKRAHYVLLWEALARLKEKNINAFDLGGVNDESAKGVKIFKEGLGGKLFQSLGLYS